MKASPDDLLRVLRAHPRVSGAELCRLLGDINRSTLMRLADRLGETVIRRGGSRRSRYALRRPLRGSAASLPLYRVDEYGQGHAVATLDLTAPEGCALNFTLPCRWPLADDLMRDGWFEGLPYFLADMRPQGFLGRHFARTHSRALGVAEDLNAWSEDDVLHVLRTLGDDASGDLILGDPAYARYLDSRPSREASLVSDQSVPQTYPVLAAEALQQGIAGSSAAGEFPKFTAMRQIRGEAVAVIVKFSGADREPSAAVQRWADLLVCEHIALEILAEQLHIAVAASRIHQHDGRTFLEVERFDRQGLHGRLPLCSLASLGGALLGSPGTAWPVSATALQRRGWLAVDALQQVALIWWFGRLIANSDMHEGNLSFQPRQAAISGEFGLCVAPVYDMLPMRYAPQRGGEVVPQIWNPPLPLPNEAATWKKAAAAALVYWQHCAVDTRVSAGFRKICAENRRTLMDAIA